MAVYTFPGQGSQRPGMGRAWVDHPSWELVGDASEAAGRDIGALLLDADAAELTATRNAQLATFTLGLVVLDAIERLGLEPSAFAGHSLGEYTALVAAGAVAFEDAVRLVGERGEAMQGAAEESEGTMAALLGINAAGADAACRRAEGEVWVANDNAPAQVVIAGTVEAVARAGDLAREMGARKVRPMPVGGAFHTPLMAPARDRLRKTLASVTFRPPEAAVTANVDAKAHVNPAEWPGLLSSQLCSPVRWRETLLSLVAEGPTTLVEVGAGGVLTGLARRTVPTSQAVAVAKPDDLDELVGVLAGDSPLHAYATSHHGEHLYVSERVVLSPAVGIFEPDPTLALPTHHGAPGAEVAVGDLIGTVAGTGTPVEIRSPFAGPLVGLLVLPGERLTAGQPVAWLRASGGPAPAGARAAPGA